MSRIVPGFGSLDNIEQRLHTIPDGFGGKITLPFRGGLLLRTITYGALAFVIMVVLARIPILGQIVTMFGWIVTYVIAPVLIAVALTNLKPEGRNALSYLTSTLACYMQPSATSAGQAVRDDSTDTLTGLTAIARPGAHDEYYGPRAIRFPVPVTITEDGHYRYHADPSAPDDPESIRHVVLDAGERLRVTS